MVSSQVLAMMQRVTATFLTETCDIEVEQDSVGQWGQPAHSWQVVATGVACRVITARPMLQSTAGQVGGQEQLVDTYRLIVPAGTALAVNQRVTVNDLTYHIVSLITERTNETDAQAVMVRARGE